MCATLDNDNPAFILFNSYHAEFRGLLSTVDLHGLGLRVDVIARVPDFTHRGAGWLTSADGVLWRISGLLEPTPLLQPIIGAGNLKPRYFFRQPPRWIGEGRL